MELGYRFKITLFITGYIPWVVWISHYLESL
jgi:hypothetical protein